MIFEMKTKLKYHRDLVNFVENEKWSISSKTYNMEHFKHTTKSDVSSCYLICPNTMIITPSASPWATAGWVTPDVPTFPMTDAQPTNTNRLVPNISARQGCTYCSKMHLFWLVLSLPTACSPISATVKTSVLFSPSGMLNRSCYPVDWFKWQTTA